MTESRDQRFFEALSNSGRDDDDALTGATGTTEANEPAAPAAPVGPHTPFAAEDPIGDPAGGRHHIDPPAPTGGAWGQPFQPTGDTAVPPWHNSAPPPSPAGPASRPDIPASPPPGGQKLDAPNLRPDASQQPAASAPADPSEEVTVQVNVTPRPESESGHHSGYVEGTTPPSPQPSGVPTGEQRQQPGPPARPAPRPVPAEERTQFLSRESLRNALAPNTAPPPPAGWPARGGAPQHGGAPQPGGWQRASQPPAPPRSPDMRPTESDQPAGPRPPEWNWSQGSGGSELRSEQISASELNAPRKIPSSRGWRKWLYYATFKLINTGESPDEQLLRNLNATVAGHLRGTYSIVVLGGKGGVGKTTTTASIGSTFAALRKDKVIAIDANPDRASNLADRIDPKATNSYTDVLADRNMHGYSDIRSHVGMNEAAGLDVLGNRYQPDRQPLSAQVYTDTHAVLQRFYSVLISDSGTDVDHPVIPGLMSRADALIMVASTAPDGAKGAAELMDWAYEAGYHRLLQRTVVVINDVRGESGKAHRKLVDSLVEKFSRWVSPQRVFVVPFDPHIASAGVIDINELRPATRRRYLEITARLASGFNSSEGAQ